MKWKGHRNYEKWKPEYVWGLKDYILMTLVWIAILILIVLSYFLKTFRWSL